MVIAYHSALLAMRSTQHSTSGESAAKSHRRLRKARCGEKRAEPARVPPFYRVRREARAGVADESTGGLHQHQLLKEREQLAVLGQTPQYARRVDVGLADQSTTIALDCHHERGRLLGRYRHAGMGDV